MERGRGAPRVGAPGRHGRMHGRGHGRALWSVINKNLFFIVMVPLTPDRHRHRHLWWLWSCTCCACWLYLSVPVCVPWCVRSAHRRVCALGARTLSSRAAVLFCIAILSPDPYSQCATQRRVVHRLDLVVEQRVEHDHATRERLDIHEGCRLQQRTIHKWRLCPGAAAKDPKAPAMGGVIPVAVHVHDDGPYAPIVKARRRAQRTRGIKQVVAMTPVMCTLAWVDGDLRARGNRHRGTSIAETRSSMTDGLQPANRGSNGRQAEHTRLALV